MPSSLYYGEQIIDDSTMEHHVLVPGGMGRGLDYATRSAEGYAGVAEPFPSSLVIPRSEWQGRIEQMEAEKSRLSDLITQAGLPPKNQEQTPYCWINAPTACLEEVRLLQNEPMVILSPASAGAPIKNFRAVGGWGREALEWIVEHGVCPVDIWPANAINRKYYTDAAKATALKYRVDKWWVLDNSLDQIASCLLRRIPVAVGLSWWSHEVHYVDLVHVNGDFGVRFRNSWGPDWPQQGAGGWSILQGRRMTPDDSVAPRTAIAD